MANIGKKGRSGENYLLLLHPFFSVYLSPWELQSAFLLLFFFPRLSVFYFDSHKSAGSFEGTATNFQKYVLGEFMQYFLFRQFLCNILGTLDGGYILYYASTNTGE